MSGVRRAMRMAALVVGALVIAAPVRGGQLVPSRALGGSAEARVVPAVTTIPTSPSNFAVRNGVAWFAATDDANGKSLWKTDGTEAGTKLLDAGIDPSDLVWAGSKLFFAATDPSFGLELFVSNGSAGNAHPIKNNPGIQKISDITAVGTSVYAAICDSAHGCEPWVSDGTPVGTFRLKDIVSGRGGSFPSGFTALGSTVLFAAGDAAHGREIWRTDGTKAGTQLLKDIAKGSNWSGPSNLVRLGSRVIFWAADNAHDFEPWASDGTSAGTRMLKDIAPGTVSSWDTSGEMVVFKNNIWFAANDSKHGNELWHTDGTPKGTKLGVDVIPGPGSSRLVNTVRAGDRLYFEGEDPTHGIELWSSDGTAAGSGMVKNLSPGTRNSWPLYDGSAVLGNKLVFLAWKPQTGREPFVTNGTGSGTFLLLDTWNGPGDGLIDGMVSLGSKVIFTPDDGTGHHLWVTDGQSGLAHTHPVYPP